MRPSKESTVKQKRKFFVTFQCCPTVQPEDEVLACLQLSKENIGVRVSSEKTNRRVRERRGERERESKKDRMDGKEYSDDDILFFSRLLLSFLHHSNHNQSVSHRP